MTYFRNIDNIAEALKRAKKECIKVNLLIGAGCSVTAGIPVAKNLINDMIGEYPDELEYVTNKTYSNCMSQLTPVERRKLINRYVKTSKVNWAHIGMAHLMNNDYIHRVLTTNFDNIFLKACSLIGEFPGIYDMTTYGKFRSDLLSDKSILYLHGQHTGFILCNTDKEVEEQKIRLQDTFNELKRNSMWIIVGYSCTNDAIWQLLSNETTFENRLYLVGYEDEKINNNMEEILGEDKYAFYVKGYNADSFFINLMQELDVFPPKIIDKPFSYLSDTINNITEYKDNDSFLARNYNGAALEILNDAIENYENNDLLMAKYYYELGLFDKFSSKLGKIDDGFDDLNTLLKKVDFKMIEEIIEFVEINSKLDSFNSKYTKKLREASLFILLEHPLLEKDNKALLNGIDEIYKKIDRNLLEIKDLDNWVNIILKIIEIDSSKDPFKDLNRAEAIYKGALSGRKEDSKILDNLSRLYLKMARYDRANPNKYIELLLSSIKKANEVDCENVEVILDWGIYLLNLVPIDEVRAEKFYIEAESKFKDAFEIVPKDILNDIRYIYTNELMKLFFDIDNKNIKTKCIYDSTQIFENIYSSENNETVIKNNWEYFLVKIITQGCFSEYKYALEKYIKTIEITVNNFKENKLLSRLVVEINNVAYSLILQNEFELSKRILEICLLADKTNSFALATNGLWNFRNKDVEIKESEEYGKKYYEMAIKSSDVKSLNKALTQKYQFEYGVFLIERKKDKVNGHMHLSSAIEIGKIGEYLSNYIAIEKYITDNDIFIKEIDQTAIDSIH